ncbi:hypothetical protein [Nakamurella deserti]|uniref:hypothetical protein n=1 Tax=Nakamurella deserti TaxID=2164074 RepID=UPI001F0BFAE6|nr:hypothetical protein [Nakamurella deserti]
MNAADPSDAATPDPGTGPSRASRRRAAPWAKVGMVLFAIGLLAIVADLVLFASGSRNLPVWLNVTCMLAPVGLGVGLVGVLREARADGRARATRVSRDTPTV